MSGFLTLPAFLPQVRPIPLGTAGQVLTMVSGVPAFAAASGGGTLTGRVLYPSPAGSSNNVNPGGGFPANKNRLVVTLAAGDATWTGLLAGSDGQLLYLTNADAVRSLTLTSQDAGSAAANQFLYTGGGIILVPGVSKVLLYDATLALWCIS